MSTYDKYPLHGLKVVELGTHIAVPNAARVMADCGASVIKVEDLKGEDWRKMGKAYFDMPVSDEENPLFTAQNTNKRFVSIDLKQSDGVVFVKKLIHDADIFMSSVRLGSLKKLGLDYESLKKEFPRLVYVHFTGFGYEGPDSDRPGFDIASFSARSGALIDWTNEGDFPCKPVTGFGDAVTSSTVLSGVMIALYARDRTGKGTLVSSSLYGSGIWCNFAGIMAAQECFDNKYPKSRYAPANPFSHFYQCKDGAWLNISILIYEPKKEKLFKALGLEELIDDPRFMTMEDVKRNVRAIVAVMNECFSRKTRDEWAAIFEQNDIVYEKLVQFADVSHDPQATVNTYLQDVRYPSGLIVKTPRFPLHFSNFETKPIVPAGGIGHDTEAVMHEHGYSEQEIRKMQENGVVR